MKMLFIAALMHLKDLKVSHSSFNQSMTLKASN